MSATLQSRTQLLASALKRAKPSGRHCSLGTGNRSGGESLSKQNEILRRRVEELEADLETANSRLPRTNRDRETRGDWLVGGGELGELIRAADWSKTSLGPRDRWPQSLRTAVNLMVESSFPMALLWGPQLLLLYNDGYREIAADKHPHALGHSTREVWSEVWHINEPIFAAVMDRGESLLFEDKLFPLKRLGRLEDAYFTLSYGPVRNDDGVISGTLVTLQETTARVRSETALRESERSLAKAQRVGGVGSWQWDLKTGAVHWSRQLYEFNGVDPDTFVPSASAFRHFVHPEDRLCVEAEIRKAVVTGAPVEIEFRIVTPAGSTRTLLSKGELVRVDPDGTPRVMLGVEQDITDRRQAEEATREALTRLQFALRSAHQGVWDWDLRTNTMLWDDEMLRLYGLTRDQFPGGVEAWKQGLHPEDRNRAIAECQAALDGIREFDTEFRVLHRDGTVRHIKADGLVLRDPSGAAIRMLGLNHDITERKQVEAALAASEARFREIFVESPIAIETYDALGRLLEINPACLELFGVVDPADVRGFNLFDDPNLSADTKVRLGRGETVRYEAGFDFEKVKSAGLYRTTRSGLAHLDVSISCLGSPAARRGYLVQVFDVTEKKRADDERARLTEMLHQAQKMEAIGTLAGGLAHDFNNILGGVLSGLSMLELVLEDADSDLRADVKDMEDLVRRGADLSRQLLGFSRRGKYDVAAWDLQGGVQKTIAMFAPTRRDISVVQDLSPDLDRVLVDYAQVEQVLLNLFLNAAHAMPNGGRLAIRGENATLTSEQTDPHGAKPGRFVRLVVTDTGTGIDPAVLPRIFEPFFTTKDVGVGTGLGLASVYGIVKNHGGIVTVESELGKGTSFTLLFPATDLHASDPPTPKASLPAGHGTVLVVDDEELVLKLCARLLRALGYDVLTASRGEKAVELVRQHDNEISVVILDLTMPEMSGAATFAAIREVSPTLKVLLASGFAVDGQAQALLDRGCNGFLQKPFDAASLSEQLQALR